jgi:hypothetical protein
MTKHHRLGDLETIDIYHIVLFFLEVLEFELRVSHLLGLLGRHCTT